MAEIAILGYGTVGSGVYETILKNQRSLDKRAMTPVHVKRVLDLRDFPGLPVSDIMTKYYDDILFDDEIKIIVEVMGGEEPAYSFCRQALLHGKSVVTSNKELVARHGAELLEIARQNRLNFLFEASVGGGIPIIRPLNKSLAADEISEITGILNGTTNYILSRMKDDGSDFKDALSDAQQNGYAERDPSADISGLDACRKLAILLSLSIGSQVDFESIYTDGIERISCADMLYASALGGVIKLLATASLIDDDSGNERERVAYGRVCPFIVPNSHPLASVNDVFNAIFVKGNIIGEVMFYGRGAGKLPTASAVVADIVDALKHPKTHIPHNWSMVKARMKPIDDLPVKMFVRMSAPIATVEEAFGEITRVIAPGTPPGEIAFVTPLATEIELRKTVRSLGDSIINTIRIY